MINLRPELTCELNLRIPSFRGADEVRSLSIPYPPSVNHYWRHIMIQGRQRSVLSKAAKEYRTNVGVAVLTQGRGATIDGPIAMEITARPPDRRRRDLDNLLKGVLDALAHAGVYADDSQIQDLRIRWGERVKLGRLEVLIQEVEG